MKNEREKRRKNSKNRNKEKERENLGKEEKRNVSDIDVLNAMLSSPS